jgi:phosphatidylinositol alpha-mannosyltransferase
VAGPGESEGFLKDLNPQLRHRVKFLGLLGNEEKQSFLKSIPIYVAPNTGSESFGIILTEALSAGTAVVASDIPAFKAVLENGSAGDLFRNGDSADLAKVLVALLRDDEKRKKLSENGSLSAQKYDWQVVAEQIESVYEMAIAGGQRVTLASESRFWSRR